MNKTQWEYSTDGTATESEPFLSATDPSPQVDYLATDSSEPFLPTNSPTTATFITLTNSIEALSKQAVLSKWCADIDKAVERCFKNES